LWAHLFTKRSLVLGDAVGHVRQMTLNNNHASNNSGIFLVTEIIMPLVILSLTLYHRRQSAPHRRSYSSKWRSAEFAGVGNHPRYIRLAVEFCSEADSRRPFRAE
jgi:hypothetical protein